MGILKRLEEASKQKAIPDEILLAAAYAAAGEKEQAFSWLDKAYENRHQALMYLNVDPQFDNLRSDQRFQALLRRIGLPQ